MDVFARFASDETKEVGGVWRDIGDGARLLIARSGNKQYARLLQREIDANSRVLDLKNDAAEEMSAKIMTEVLATTVQLGWEGIKFKGDAMPYTVENARTLLGVKDFRKLVTELSSDFEAYRVQQEAALVKS